MNQVLGFEQSKWINPYIQLNTERRKSAANKFEESFFKLMNNAAYGKLCEGKRKRLNVKLVRSVEELLQYSDRCGMSSIKIIEDDFATVSMKQTRIVWDRPKTWQNILCITFIIKK